MSKVTQYMAQAVGQTLEETTNLIAESLTLRHLGKYGQVSLEEASFYHDLAAQVITEGAEEFIPDEVETDDPMDTLELYDAAGNCYAFDPNTGSLTPIDAPEGIEDEMEEQEPEIEPVEPVEPVVPPMEESTVVTSAPLIEESSVNTNQSVVARILANIK